MNKIGKPNLEVFSETLLNEARKNKNIIVESNQKEVILDEMLVFIAPRVIG